MRKSIILSILIISIFIIACKQIEVEPAAPTTTPSEEVITPTAPITPTETKEMSQELKNLIAKTDKVKSLAYFYDDGETAFQAYVKDNFMKIEFTERKPVKDEKGKTLYDTAYIDLDKKTVEVYCERYWDCHEFTDKDTPVEGVAAFNDFITQSPIDLIKSVQYAEINPTGGQRLDNGKDAVQIEYTDTDGNLVKIWLWDYRGIPLLYQKFKKGADADELISQIEYHQVSIDTVLFKDVTKQT